MCSLRKRCRHVLSVYRGRLTFVKQKPPRNRCTVIKCAMVSFLEQPPRHCLSASFCVCSGLCLSQPKGWLDVTVLNLVEGESSASTAVKVGVVGGVGDGVVCLCCVLENEGLLHTHIHKNTHTRTDTDTLTLAYNNKNPPQPTGVRLLLWFLPLGQSCRTLHQRLLLLLPIQRWGQWCFFEWHIIFLPCQCFSLSFLECDFIYNQHSWDTTPTTSSSH